MSDKRLWSPKVPFDPATCPFFYGWVIVVVATVGIIFSIPGQTMGFSVFTDILMRELGLTRVELSLAYCVGTVLSGFTLPCLGRMFDRVGARRMLVYAALATGTVLLYLSQVRRVLDLLKTWVGDWVSATAIAFGVILVGFYLIRASAQGVLTLTSRNAIGKWFDYRRGVALSLSGVVTAFAFSAAPRGLDLLVAWLGWDGAWLMLGGLTLTVMVGVAWLFVRDNPEECGMKMDGDVSLAKRGKAHADSVMHHDFTRGEAVRTWAFWMFNLSFVFISFHSTSFTFHIQSIGAEAGRERSQVFGYFVPMSFVSVATNLLCGWLSSRTRLKLHLAAMNVGSLIGVVGLVYLDSPLGVAAFILGNGIGGGFFVALSGVVWPRFYGRQWLGAISGLGMASMVVASGVGPLVFSLSLRLTGSYEPIIWMAGLVPFSLLIGSFWADNPQRRFMTEDG
ncbi:MFS transporter [Verrucomicrobiales bacterium]|nr:MFS transporter [Verrucomicrobiales bacterium]